MTHLFEVGQIVRRYDTKRLYRIIGLATDVDLLEVQDVNTGINEGFLHPDNVELFEYTHNAGSYQLGDEVRMFGYEGTWFVLYFITSRLHGELLVAVENSYGKLEVVPAHYVKPIPLQQPEE